MKTPMTPADNLLWALEFCRKARLRLTPPREKLLRFLAEQSLPVTIEVVSQSETLAGTCAETTIYRTLMLFREANLVRQISLPRKTSYFILNAPGHPSDFLVCRACGAVRALAASASVRSLEQEVTRQLGFAGVFHELELYGICPECQQSHHHTTPPTKLASMIQRG
jgi:Fe2+ or Zn2+ uptake regulation protein